MRGGYFQEKIVLNEPVQSSDSICRQEKLRLLLDLSCFGFFKERWVVPLLSASLLLLLMVFVGVHLRASLPLKWKDAHIGRKQGGKEIYKDWIS